MMGEYAMWLGEANDVAGDKAVWELKRPEDLPSLINFVMDRVRAGAESARRKLSSICTLCMTAFHLTRPGQKLESTAMRRAVGPFVASSSNIFALSAPDKSDLPSDLRDDITKLAAAHKVENEPAETRHLKLYAGYLRGFSHGARGASDGADDPRDDAYRHARGDRRFDPRDEEGGHPPSRDPADRRQSHHAAIFLARDHQGDALVHSSARWLARCASRRSSSRSIRRRASSFSLPSR